MEARVHKWISLIFAFLAAGAHGCAAVGAAADPRPGRRPPNVVLVVADDLGAAELGCYGQARIRTPRIDALAREGVRLTDFDVAAPVCAPSRAMLLTGLHAGHAPVRDNREVGAEGQFALPRSATTVAQDLAARGYATGLFGKWGLGGPGSGSEPGDFGFGRFVGYLCQRKAHDHYPDALWSDRTPLPLPGNAAAKDAEAEYAHDVIRDAATAFVAANRDRPFFLCFASPLPHLALQVPPAELRAYEGTFPEAPYDGSKGYRAHPTPRAAYAAMVTRFDRDVGAIVDALRAAGLERDTIVLVTGDNGATHDVGGVDTAFFRSVGDLRGRKGSLWEGGLRVPFVAWAPGRLPAGRVLDGFAWTPDLRATIDAWCGAAAPATDGRDLGPWLAGTAPMPVPAAAYAGYWEFPGYGGQQAVRFAMDGRAWKAVRRDMGKAGAAAPVQLFDLAADPNERTDVAAAQPAAVARAMELMRAAHAPNADFPMPGVDAK
jgi:arylsulfatase